jgi:hypothetical protein
MNEFNQEKIFANLKHAENNSVFWGQWEGTADRALAHLTDDIYAYEAENNAYGKGVAIKYGSKNFWYSPQEKALFNSTNTRITAEEMRSLGDNIMPEQINRLIENALMNIKKNGLV